MRCGQVISMFALLGALFGLSADARAHGGQYSNPAIPRPDPSTPSSGKTPPRGGGVTAATTPNWENWWEHNKEEFFDVRARRQAKSDQEQEAGEGYTGSDLHQSASRSEIRDVIVPTIAAALKDKSSDVRDAAAIAMGRIGMAPELAKLQPLLDDANTAVREAAILGIGLLKHSMAEEVLIGLMQKPDTDAKERGLCALALGLSGGDRALAALKKNLGSDSPLPGVAAVKARQLEGARALGIGLFAKAENAAVLLDAFKKGDTKDAAFRPLVLVGLSRAADASCQAIVFEGLRDKKDDVRRGAAILAGRCFAADQTKEVKKLVALWDEENDLHARAFLTISLGRIGGDSAVPKLKTIFKEARSKDDRAFAAIALGIAKSAAEAPLLREALQKEKDISVRSAAAVALAIMDDAESAKAIHALLANENPELQSYMVTALAMLDHKPALVDVRRLVGEARHPLLARNSGLALGLMHDTTALDQMLSQLRNSGSIAVKGGMATAIGRIGDRRSIDRLIEIVKDASATDQTRAFAVVALGLIGDKSQRSEFTRISIDSNFGLQTCEAFSTAIDVF